MARNDINPRKLTYSDGSDPTQLEVGPETEQIRVETRDLIKTTFTDSLKDPATATPMTASEVHQSVAKFKQIRSYFPDAQTLSTRSSIARSSVEIRIQEYLAEKRPDTPISELPICLKYINDLLGSALQCGIGLESNSITVRSLNGEMQE